MIIIASREEKELLQRLRALEHKDRAGLLTEEITGLKRQISDLEIAKAKTEEAFAREERELRHMIGLEKKRQEFEIQSAKTETSLKVREENLSADRKRFDEQMEFNTERFEKMETYLKEMMSEILKRLPNINMEIGRPKR